MGVFWEDEGADHLTTRTLGMRGFSDSRGDGTRPRTKTLGRPLSDASGVHVDLAEVTGFRITGFRIRQAATRRRAQHCVITKRYRLPWMLPSWEGTAPRHRAEWRRDVHVHMLAEQQQSRPGTRNPTDYLVQVENASVSNLDVAAGAPLARCSERFAVPEVTPSSEKKARRSPPAAPSQSGKFLGR